MSIEGIIVGLLADRHRCRLGVLRAQAVHDPAAPLGVLLRPDRRRPVGPGRLRRRASSRRSCRGASASCSASSSPRSRSSGTTPRSSSSAARSATRSASASSTGCGFEHRLPRDRRRPDRRRGLRRRRRSSWACRLLVIVFSAFSGAAAVVNGVLILFGQIKLERPRLGHLRRRCCTTASSGSSRGSSCRCVALCLPDPRRRARCHLDRPERLPLLAVGRPDHEPRSLVAAIDQGTTSSRCILFDRSGRPVASHQLEHAQITPRPGWVEHDADEILERVRTCVRVALRDVGRRRARAGRRRHQRPARDDRRLGPPDRAPGPQRDRLAGHPDRRGGRAPRRRRPGRHGPLPRADRAADLDLLVGAQARLDPRGGRAGATRRGRGRRPAVRHDRHAG